MKKRIEWIDIAKFIGIFFVMFSHFEICPEYLRVFFTPFYLSIFFFCSGYCYKHTDDFPSFIKKKIRQLFIPWLIYSNLNIILSNILSFKHHANGFATEVFRNLLQIRYYDERLWFIPAMFSAYIPFFFLIRSYQKNKNTKSLLFVCTVLALIRKLYKAYMNPQWLPWNLTSLPWHIDYIPTAMFFMALGYIYKNEWEKYLDPFFDLRKEIALTCIYCFLVYFAYFSDIAFPLLIDFLYDHIRHICGLLFIIQIAKKISPNKYVLYVGSNTLLYFCLHNKAITLTETVFKKFLPDLFSSVTGNALLSTAFCLIFTIVISIVLIIPTELIHRYLPWTIGKPMKNNAHTQI
nr:acyltransferase family protein [Clostridia bacterium]